MQEGPCAGTHRIIARAQFLIPFVRRHSSCTTGRAVERNHYLDYKRGRSCMTPLPPCCITVVLARILLVLYTIGARENQPHVGMVDRYSAVDVGGSPSDAPRFARLHRRYAHFS